MSINTFVALVATISAAVSALILSPEAMTHNQAKMYCATMGSRLADVTTANMDSVKGQLKGQSAWVGSWDFNFYNNNCMHFHNGHIGQVDCSALHVAACNDPILLKSTSARVPAEKAAAAAKDQKSGARASRRSRKDKCEPSCVSSSSSCVSDSQQCGFEYVYLTQTVTQVYTSAVPLTVTTSTFTSTTIIGTVAAYVATANG